MPDSARAIEWIARAVADHSEHSVTTCAILAIGAISIIYAISIICAIVTRPLVTARGQLHLECPWEGPMDLER